MTNINRFNGEFKTKAEIDLAQIREINQLKGTFLNQVFEPNRQVLTQNPNFQEILNDAQEITLLAPKFELNELLAEIVLELDPLLNNEFSAFTSLYQNFFEKFYGIQKFSISKEKAGLLNRVKPTPADLEEWLSNLRAFSIILEKFHGQKGQQHLKDNFLRRYIKYLTDHEVSVDHDAIKNPHDIEFITRVKAINLDFKQRLHNVKLRIKKTIFPVDTSEDLLAHPQPHNPSNPQLFFTALNLKFPDPSDLLDVLLYQSTFKVH